MELLFSNMSAQWVIIPLHSLIHTLCNSFWLFHIRTYPHVQEVLHTSIKRQCRREEICMSFWETRNLSSPFSRLFIDWFCLFVTFFRTAQVVVFIRSVSICGVKQLQALTDWHWKQYLNYFSMSVQALVYHPSLSVGGRCREAVLRVSGWNY